MPEPIKAAYLVSLKIDMTNKSGITYVNTKGFVEAMRDNHATPHVAQNTTNRASAIDGRTTRHEGYKVSIRIRKRIEEAFGWIKAIGNFRKTRHKGVEKVDWYFTLTAAAYNLIRMRKLGVASTL